MGAGGEARPVLRDCGMGQLDVGVSRVQFFRTVGGVNYWCAGWSDACWGLKRTLMLK